MTLTKVYAFLDELWFDNDLFFCWGCGTTGIEHHHIISRQDMRKIGRMDLLTDPENIIPLCHNCHHNKWHDGGTEKRKELRCLNVIMDYYKKEAPELYWNLKYKLNGEG